MKVTLFNLAKRHVFTSKKQLIVLLLTALVLYLKTVSKLKQQAIISHINNPRLQDEKKISDLIYFSLISFLFSFSVPSLELLANSFETDVLKSIFTSSYAQFIKYRYNDWHNYLLGDLYSVIYRRSSAVAKFYKHGFFEALDTFLYILAGIATLIFKFGLLRHFKFGLAFLLLVPLLLNSLSIIRNKILRKSDEAYDQGEKTLKDIFLNYELIHTYNTFDDEMLNYRRDMRNAKFWFVTYWLCNDVLDLIYKFSKISLIAIVFNQIDFEAMHFRDIFLQMTVFQSVSKRMNAFAENAKKMVEATENSLHSKLDLLKPEASEKTIRKFLFESEIQFKNLAKFYNENLVFENINLKILKGQKVAIIGANGTGKSSFVKSLIGIETFNGEINIDGVNIKDIYNPDYRRLISYVPQSSSIFDATVYENITAFDTKLPSDQVYRMISDYGMEKEFKELGYNTVISENDTNISSTMRQKICLMRAIIKDAPILVLDEVTSEMDKNCEGILIDNIISKAKDRTVIMIVHNLELFSKFDKIIELGNATLIN